MQRVLKSRALRSKLTATKGGLLWVVLCLCLAVFVQPAGATITWSFDYGADNSVGFWDATNGATRRTALENAAAQWGTYFNDTATVTMAVTSTEDTTTNNLASAGTNYVDGYPGDGFGQQAVVRNKIVSGGTNDLNGAAADGTVNVNWGQNWGLSSDAAGVAAGDYDFYSTIFHELTHAMGFASSINVEGTSIWNSGEPAWDLFDQFIVDASGNAVVDPNSYLLNQATWDINRVGGPSPGAGLFFNGASAVLANGGNPVGLYTPVEWEQGSSVSHTDDQNTDDYLNWIMNAATEAGPGTRTMSLAEIGMMTDIGYSVVPIPSSVFLLACGVGALMISRRKKPLA